MYLHRYIYHTAYSTGVQWILSPIEELHKIIDGRDKAFKTKKKAYLYADKHNIEIIKVIK